MRFLVSVLAIVLVSCGGDGVHAKEPNISQSGSQAPEIGVVKVARRNLQRTLMVSSELVPFQQIDVYAKESGFVKTLNVDYGTHVRQGQLMAVLEIPELQMQLVEDQADVKDAQSQVDRATNVLHRVQAQQKVADLEYTRLDKVAKSRPGLVAQQEVDDSQGKDLAAEAQVAAAQSALQSAQSEFNRAQARQRRDQALFDYSKIIAPFSGVVTKRYANLGTLLQSGMNSSTQAMPLVQLSEDDLFRLVIPVSESYAPDIHLGDSVNVRVPVLQRDFTGHVARFAVDLEETTRTMHTEVDVPNPERVLMPGMYAEATVTFDRRTNVAAVPPQAVNIDGDQRSVWVVEPSGKVENRKVVLGVETPDYIEAVSGLRNGEMVAVGDRSRLHDGEMVRPKEVQLIQYQGG
ncbi:MAG TPA: efflux RND transporter periplasmic adaptor subunit [Bryobacteraceae bacterium]|nr:efflux RND transporter periplasmic adaptor subunit [Bryobacteraceae bacterium]